MPTLFDDEPRARRRRDGAKDVELTAGERDLIIAALEHHVAYLRAVRRSNQALNDLLERFRDLRED